MLAILVHKTEASFLVITGITGVAPWYNQIFSLEAQILVRIETNGRYFSLLNTSRTPMK